MQRRDFFRLSVVGAVGSALAMPQSLADVVPAGAAGGVYFTKAAPGRWKGKEAGHLPNIEIARGDGDVTLTVLTAHEMKGYEHYIVKHVLLNKQFQFLDEHLFNPLDDKVAQSVFTLKGYTGKVYALSMCNKHDVWLSETTI